ncbi:MAG: L-threonylcarbamoyladenylate synthase [Firmicutes bacterium]|nr:L-threonylcarbamoyladenylate synthase [Bacillota bacterium]
MSRTEYIKVNARQPEIPLVEIAAKYIKAGELVAFPTETVYGLGADAFQPAAVEKIFMAKGRPPAQALLVHVSNREQVYQLAAEVPAIAVQLMDQFWPGPLSIILPSRPQVPEIVRAGQAGVGLRMPAHPVALALIARTGPLAAPSANLYGHPSPTNAQHVKHDLDGKIAAVLDAGDTGAGLESTLLDLTTARIRLLRPGGIKIEEIEQFIGQTIEIAGMEPGPAYKTGLRVVLSDDQADFERKRDEFMRQSAHLAVVLIDGRPESGKIESKYVYNLQLNGSGMSLYAILRAAVQQGSEILLVAPLDPNQAGAALMDRLRRAAAVE